jgi:5,10-methylenetetrahydromethanopterin reductase
MRPIGISVASRSGLSPTKVASAARAAEVAGCTAFFVSERVADAVALSQVALAATDTIRVGTAVANAALRHPALLAMTASTLADAYGGRFVLGLGIANRRLNQDLLGMAPIRSDLTFMRSYVSVLRGVWSGPSGPLAADPFHIGQLHLDRPAGGPVPVYLAGLLPRMLQLAGETADGVLLNLTSASRLPTIMANIAVGAARAGRDPAGVPVQCLLPTCLSDDTAAAAAAARSVVVGYAQHPAARQLFGESGFAAEIDAIDHALRAGDQAGATALVTDELAGAFVLYGTPADCLARIDDCRAAGVTLPILFPMPVAGDWDGAIDRAVALAAEYASRKESPCSNVPTA